MAATGGVARLTRLSEPNGGQKLPRFDVSTHFRERIDVKTHAIWRVFAPRKLPKSYSTSFGEQVGRPQKSADSCRAALRKSVDMADVQIPTKLSAPTRKAAYCTKEEDRSSGDQMRARWPSSPVKQSTRPMELAVPHLGKHAKCESTKAAVTTEKLKEDKNMEKTSQTAEKMQKPNTSPVYSHVMTAKLQGIHRCGEADVEMCRIDALITTLEDKFKCLRNRSNAIAATVSYSSRLLNDLNSFQSGDSSEENSMKFGPVASRRDGQFVRHESTKEKSAQL
ncbi:hypothetical protein SprV_0200597000 [Sparganum proliferum]